MRAIQACEIESMSTKDSDVTRLEEKLTIDLELLSDIDEVPSTC